MTLKTEFAPAERASQEEIASQVSLLENLPFVRSFMDAIPMMSVVVNEQRQIVFANRVFLEFIGQSDRNTVFSQRPGEALGCVRSCLSDGGCGTTLFCRTCGAVNSILNSQKTHSQDVQECRLIYGTAGSDETSRDLRVWSRPLVVNGDSFTLFSVADVSDEKRRKALERIFFHDVLNTAGGVKGLADILREPDLPVKEVQEVATMLSDSTDQLIEEISAQRILTQAELGELPVRMQDLQSTDLLRWILHQFHSADVAKGKTLRWDPATENHRFSSDPVLLRRVLINLVKNALEAIPEGDVVTLAVCSTEAHVCFSVHHQGVIPEEVQRQIFSRSFSTKGNGRGLGTYSVKLISEKYLHGNVSFVSTAEEGTRFTVCYPQG